MSRESSCRPSPVRVAEARNMFDLKQDKDNNGTFPHELLKRTALVTRLLVEEGVVQDDVLRLTCDISLQCEELINDGNQINQDSLKILLCKIAGLLRKVRPVDLDLLLQLLNKLQPDLILK